MRIVTALLVLLVLAGTVPAAFAQGCVMCRQTAAAGGAETAKAMDLAIVVLLVPTISIFVGILVWAFRRRNRSPLDETPTGQAPFPYGSLDNPRHFPSIR